MTAKIVDRVDSRVTQKNGFVKVSKKLDTDLKIILLDRQSNYVRRSNC